MKLRTRTCWIVIVLTVVTSATPTQELTAEDLITRGEQLVRTPAFVARDIELLPGGMLAGQVVDRSGQPVGEQMIVVQQPGLEAISSRSDHEGNFRLAGVSAGLCVVACGEQAVVCRCWSPQTAPPIAGKQLLLTTGEVVARGQRAIADLLTGPVLIGMIIGAAIVIPIAIHNSKRDAS